MTYFEVQRYADCLHAAAGRGGKGNRQGLPEGRISAATFHNWRKKYGGLLSSEMKRLKQIEEENSKLKKLVADLSLDNAMREDVITRKP